MKSLKNKTFAKVIGIISALAIIISALYVPMSFGASAAAIAVTEDETVTFGFETSEGSVDADDDGFSVHSGGGWGFGVRSDIVSGTTGIGFHYTNPVGWVTPRRLQA